MTSTKSKLKPTNQVLLHPTLFNSAPAISATTKSSKFVRNFATPLDARHVPHCSSPNAKTRDRPPRVRILITAYRRKRTRRATKCVIGGGEEVTNVAYPTQTRVRCSRMGRATHASSEGAGVVTVGGGRDKISSVSASAPSTDVKRSRHGRRRAG